MTSKEDIQNILKELMKVMNTLDDKNNQDFLQAFSELLDNALVRQHNDFCRNS